MAKFRFHLQSILNVKYKLEEQAKNRYGAAVAKLREEESVLEALKEQRYGYQKRLQQHVVSSEHCLSLPDIRQLEDGVELMKYKEKMQKIAIRRARNQVDAARAQLDEAMKERKIYEKLREKAFDAFKKEIEAEERKEVDELVSFRFGPGGTDDAEDIAI